MYCPANLLEVRAWGTTVGTVATDLVRGAYVFDYDPKWQAKGIELAPLTMPVSQARHVFPLLPEVTFKRLPSLLADALPDDFGKALMDAYLVKKGFSSATITPLDRLAYMGQRGMGALEFRPALGLQNIKATLVDISQLVMSAGQALSGKFGDDSESDVAFHALVQVGTSAGGARAKVVIAWNPETREIRSGQVPVDDGFEYWLLKLDGVGKDHELGSGGHYGRIEYAYHLMATAAGISMSSCRLLEENGRAHFMTRRFDRHDGNKLHLQTLCAMQHLDYKQRGTHDYAQYFETIVALKLPETALVEGFRRMVFNVLAANCDDHTKNLSFLMDREGRWQLAPAYDVTHAYNPKGEWTYQHLMSVNGKFHNIARTDLEAVGEHFRVPDYHRVIAEVAQALKRWPEFAAAAGIPSDEMSRIQADFVM